MAEIYNLPTSKLLMRKLLLSNQEAFKSWEALPPEVRDTPPHIRAMSILHVCMYVCMYECMYVCMYVYEGLYRLESHFAGS